MGQVIAHDGHQHQGQKTAADKQPVEPLVLAGDNGLVELDDLPPRPLAFGRDLLRFADSHQLVQGAVHGHDDVAHRLEAGVVRLAGEDAVDGPHRHAGQLRQLLVGEFPLVFQFFQLCRDHFYHL